MNIQPHLKIKQGDIAENVLLPGDPARAELIAQRLERARLVARNREFTTYTGKYRGVDVSVTSTGMGCPSTAIAVEELARVGARVFIRVGTCGGAWRADIKPGSVVVPTACVRDEGTTLEYVPAGFPAVADVEIVNALAASARQCETPYAVGINRTHDAFYAPIEAASKWGRYFLDSRFMNLYTPILSSDMETSALFILASLLGLRAGAVLGVNAVPEPLRVKLTGSGTETKAELSKDCTQEVEAKAIEIALEAILVLAQSNS